ncbi:hypothetical protein Pfo_031104 [Paulownia fortunei]|nr:hypothetical protein Pfo_031104 [Paulownia fortunei]
MTTRKVAVVKITTSNSSNAAGRSIGVVTRSMLKKLLSSSEITPLLKTVEKDLPHLANTNEDDGDLKHESASSTVRSASSYSFTSNIAPVMAIEGLTKHVQEQDAQITKLMNKVDNADVSHVMGKQVEVHDEVETSTKQQSSEKEKPSTQEFQVSSNGLIPVDQLKDFIMGTIKDKFDRSSKSFLTYAKPYTQRIDNLKITVGYQSPKFQQFNGKGNPKQHMAHFIETCNDAGIYGDYLVKQFVCSLKGNVFDWYTDLEANSIDSWEQLEQEFLNRFYSTRCTVSMIELMNSHQWKEEPVIDYINHRLSEASAIEMCIQRMHWGLRIAASGVEGLPIQEPQRSKERYEAKKEGKSFFKAPNKESMAVSVAPIKFKGNTNDKSGEKKDTPQERGQRKLTLKEMQAKQILFFDSDVSGMFDDLLKENHIELPEMKCLEEAGRVDDPKYCKYHHLVGHPIHDCFIFKDKVMQLAHQERSRLRKIMQLPILSPSNLDILIDLTDEDFLFGSKPHNRPLFITGYTREQKVNRILIDGGSTVNILPLRTLTITRLMIQGFNQGGQRALGIIRLKLLMDNMASTVLFHFIDAKTSYNMLLGRTWLHENGYCRDGMVKKYYLEDAKKLKAKDSPSHEKSKQQNDGVEGSKTKNTLPTHRDHIKGESSPTEVGPLKELVLPLMKLDAEKLSSQPLEGFVRPTQVAETEHGVCIGIQNTKCFDPKAYKLLVKIGYNQKESSVLGKLIPETIGEQVHGLTTTQNTQTGIGFVPQNPIRMPLKEPAPIMCLKETFHRQMIIGLLKKLGSKTINHQRLVISKNSKYLKRVSRPQTTQKLQSLIPSRMRRCTTLLISCEKVLKVKLQTIIFTQTQNDEDDRESVASSYHITLSEEMEEEDAEVAPPELVESIKATVDELKEINLGDVHSPRPIYISALLAIDEERAYLKLLHEFKDVFACSYKEMPGLDPKVAIHHLSVKKGARPLVPLIETELNKLIEVGFIREVKYPTWISSIIPVRKKNGQIRVYVDFRYLNDACPKDDFSLPTTELIIDATTGHEALSFMDGSSGYNQIRMAPKDEELMAFRTPKVIYCYKIMLAMQKIFDDMLHKNIKCYVDDVVIKSKKQEDHLLYLRKVLERLRRYQLKMNLLKCAFGVKSGKFLGFIVCHRGIEIEQAKLAYLQRFISNLAGRCQPFSQLMKKGIPFEWNKSCRNAFESIKTYLIKRPVLVAPVPGRPLILYIAAQECSVGTLLAQENNDGKESALYYLSRMITPNELNYSPIEKICLALIFTIQKLKHYFQAHTVRLISKANPLKYVMTRPVLSDKLVRWYLQLQQFEIIYVPQKAVKEQVLADFLVDHPIPTEWELSDDLPDEDVLVIEITPPWKMYFDGAFHKKGAGIGVIFITSDGEVLPYSFILIQNYSNNVAEYQALILGLEMTVDIKQLHLKVYGDSKLVVHQLLGLYEVKKPELLPCFNYARRLIGWLGDVVIEHIPRTDNKQADALANLASILAMPEGEARVPICRSWVVPLIFEDENCDEDEENHVVEVFEVEKEDWHQPLVDYLKYEKLLDGPPRFIHYKSTLYRCSFDGVFLRCLGDDEAIQAIEEAHSGICGAHQLGLKLHFRIKRIGYYWPTMVKDCIYYAQRCQACQFHANLIHQPPEPLHPTVASWPFDAWGLDVVGPMTKSSGEHLYIFAATDYFSKWVEAIPLKEVKKENIVDFIRINIIYRYGIPRYIITDNGKPFCNSLIDKLYQKFSFKQRKSSMYYAVANGLAEAFNKTLIGEALWAYRTTFRTPTQATPYALVYSVDAIVPLEQQIPSLRIAVQEGLIEEENGLLHLEELEGLNEKRLEAQQILECYQARLSRAFNKKVRSSSFQVGDLVLVVRRPIITTHRTGNKFTSKWDGPYVVKEVYTNGAYKLVAEDGLRIGPINGKFLKLYCA